jgi:hypothetical protein
VGGEGVINYFVKNSNSKNLVIGISPPPRMIINTTGYVSIPSPRVVVSMDV